MVTGSRVSQAKLAIECFRHQSYPNLELVIVDDSERDELAEHVADAADDRIRMVRIPDEGTPLGELRNIGVEHARGELLCQWDDDDLYDPDRLLWQVAALTAEEATACFLERWLILWTAGPRLAIGTRRVWEGSMLVRREALDRYPPLRRGEDTAVIEGLLQHSKVALLDAPELYLYVVHGRNTFDQRHFDAHWGAATYLFEDPQRALSHLQQRLPVQATLSALQG